jgi:hypothetical protein
MRRWQLAGHPPSPPEPLLDELLDPPELLELELLELLDPPLLDPPELLDPDPLPEPLEPLPEELPAPSLGPSSPAALSLFPLKPGQPPSVTALPAVHPVNVTSKALRAAPSSTTFGMVHPVREPAVWLKRAPRATSRLTASFDGRRPSRARRRPREPFR